MLCGHPAGTMEGVGRRCTLRVAPGPGGSPGRACTVHALSVPFLGLWNRSHLLLSPLAAGRKSLTYFHHNPRAALQEVTFDLQEMKKIFFGSFHKVSRPPEPVGPALCRPLVHSVLLCCTRSQP